MHQKPFACKNSPQKTVLILLWPVVDFWGRRIPEATTHGPQMSWLRDSPLFCWLQGCLCFDGWLIIYMLSTEYIHCTGVIFPVSFPMQCIGLAVHDTAASPSNSSRPRLSEGILSGWGGSKLYQHTSCHQLLQFDGAEPAWLFLIQKIIKTIMFLFGVWDMKQGPTLTSSPVRKW